MGFSPDGVCSCLVAANYVAGQRMAIARGYPAFAAAAEDDVVDAKRKRPTRTIVILRSRAFARRLEGMEAVALVAILRGSPQPRRAPQDDGCACGEIGRLTATGTIL